MWTTPLTGGHKLNVDTSRIERSNNAAISRVIRDDKGRIETAFARPIGDIPILMAGYMASALKFDLQETEIFGT